MPIKNLFQAFELNYCKFDPPLEKAILFAVGNTLVCEDLEKAKLLSWSGERFKGNNAFLTLFTCFVLCYSNTHHYYLNGVLGYSSWFLIFLLWHLVTFPFCLIKFITFRLHLDFFWCVVAFWRSNHPFCFLRILLCTYYACVAFLVPWILAKYIIVNISICNLISCNCGRNFADEIRHNDWWH